MKRAFIGILLLSLVAPAVQALTLSPDIVFTLRDEFPPLDGIADFSSTGPSGFTGFITNVDFIDETFFEYAVGSEIVASATLSIGAVIYDPLGTNMTMDVSSYNNGTGAVQFGLFGTGDYLATVPLTEFFTLNTIVLDISALYNNAVAANDDFLGFRLHNAIAIDGNIPQASRFFVRAQRNSAARGGLVICYGTDWPDRIQPSKKSSHTSPHRCLATLNHRNT